MPVDVTVKYEGESVILSFDVMPSFEQLHEAIRQDLVGPAAPAFAIVGTTLRGTNVAIANQGALNRVCSDGSNFSVVVSASQPTQADHKALPVAASPLPPQSPKFAHQTAAAANSSKPSKPSLQLTSASHFSSVPAARTLTSVDDASLSPAGLQCHGVLDVPEEASKVGVATASGLMWLAEQRTGSIVIRQSSTGAVRCVIPHEQFQALGEPPSACLCMVLCRPASDDDEVEHLWAGFSNSRVRVFDCHSCTVIATLIEHEAAVTCIERTGLVVISGSADRTVRVWNSESFRVIRVLRGHDAPLVGLAADGNFLFSASADRRVLLWNVTAGEAKVHVEEAHEGGISAMAAVFLGDSDRSLWSGGEEGRIRVWEIVSSAGTTLRLGNDFKEHTGPVASLARCGSRVLSLGTQDRRLVVFDAAARCRLSSMHHLHHPTAIVKVSATVETHLLWLTGGSDKKLSLWTVLGNVLPLRGPAPPLGLYGDDADAAFLARELDHVVNILKLSSAEHENRLRLMSDEQIVRQLVLGEIENFCRRRHFVPRQRAADLFGDVVFDSKIEVGMSGVTSAAQLANFGQAVITQANQLVRSANEKNVKLLTNFRQLQEDLEEHVGTLKNHNRTLVEENRALRGELEHITELCSKRELETEAANATKKQLEQALSHYEDDLRGVERRKTELERENSSIADSALSDKRRLEVQLNKMIEECKELQRKHAAQSTDLEGRLEEANRDGRKLRLDLANTQQSLELVHKKYEQREKSAKEEEERLLQQLEHERQVMCGQQSAAEEQHTLAQRALSAKVDSQSQEISLLRQRLREAQQTVADLSSHVTESQANIVQLTAKHEEESAMLKTAFDEATSSWKKEVTALQGLLREKTSVLAGTEHRLRTIEVDTTAAQGAVQRLQRELDTTAAENKLLREGKSSIAELSEQKVLSLSHTVSTLKKEVSSLEAAVRQERNGRADAERMLAIAEENYESVQRQHHEVTASTQDEATRRIQSLQLNLRSVEEKLVNTTKENKLAYDSLLLQHQSATSMLAKREKEIEDAREELEEQLRRASSLALDLAQAKQQAEESSVQRRRGCELRDSELESLRQRFQDETKRLSDILAAKNKEIEEMQLALLAANDKFASVDTRVQSLAFDNTRLRSDLTRQAQESDHRKDADAARFAAQEAKFEQTAHELESTRASHLALMAECERQKSLAESLREQLETSSRDVSARGEVHKVSLAASNEQIEKLNARIRQMTAAHESANAVHEQYIGEAEAERAKLAEELMAATDKIQRAQEAAAQQKAGHESVVGVLHERLTAREHDLSKVQSDLAALAVEYEGKLSTSQNEHTTLRNEIASLKKDKIAAAEASANDQRSLADALEAAQQRIADGQHEVTKKNEEIAALQRLYAEQHRKETTSFEKRLELTRQSQNDQVAALTAELEASRSRIASLIDQLHAANEKIFALEENERRQLRSVDSTAQEWQLQVKGLQAELDATRLARDKMHADIQRLSDAMKAENDAHIASMAARNAEVEEARSQAREKSSEHEMTALECQRQLRRITELEEELRFTTKRAQQQDEAASTQTRDLSKSLDEALAEGVRARSQLSDEQEALKKAQSELNNALREVTTIRSLAADRETAHQMQIAEKVNELNTARAQCQEAVTSSNSAAATAAALKANLEGAVAERDMRCEELRQLCLTYKNEVTRLHQLLEGAEQHHVGGLASRDGEVRQLQIDLESAKLAHKDVTVRYLEATKEIQTLTSEYDRAFALLEATQETLRRYQATDQQLVTGRGGSYAGPPILWSRERENYEKLVLDLRSEVDGQRHRVSMYNRLQGVQAIVFQQLYTMMLQAFDAKVTLVLGQLVATFAAFRQDATANRLLRGTSVGNQVIQHEEVNQLIGDQRVLLQQYDTLRSAHETQAELLNDMRTELSLLYGRYRMECEQHEVSKAEMSRSSQRPPSTLLPHLVDLVQGMKEASRLLIGLGSRPPVLPDTNTLVVLHDWLVSARSRGEALVKSIAPASD